jgi:nucleotide-binding universal stress UspA family protein
MHVLNPVAYSVPDVAADTIAAQEQCADREMQRLAQHFAGLPTETIVECGLGIWSSVERVIEDCGVDLIVLGTHERRGVSKLLLGSVAEEIFRKSCVPVLTVGPNVPTPLEPEMRFRRILLAASLGSGSSAAPAYAISLTEKSRALLTVIHVIREVQQSTEQMNESLDDIAAKMPPERPTRLTYDPQKIIGYGGAAERILEAARERQSNLIVMGIRGAAKHLGAAVHLGQATAHKIVVAAACPVLTVRN